MDIGPHFTTTEKLVVSRAIDIYGIDDEASVTNYIAAMYSYMHPNKWREVYRCVLGTYKDHGYLSPVDFCEDLRLEAAMGMYVEKVQLRNRVLEGEDVPYPEHRDEYDWRLGDVEGVAERLHGQAEESMDSRHLYSTIDPRLMRQHVEAMSRQQNELKGIGTSDASMDMREGPVALDKEKRRAYCRMTDEERELDDFIDRVEEEDYNRPVQGHVAPNSLRGKYPAMKTALLGVERMHGVEKNKTPLRTGGLSEQYKGIVKKVAGTRRQEKDKTLWAQELRTIIRYYMSTIGMVEELERAEASMRDNNTTQVVLNVLIVLQDVINRTRDEEMITKCANFKRDLASFSEYYRR